MESHSLRATRMPLNASNLLLYNLTEERRLLSVALAALKALKYATIWLISLSQPILTQATTGATDTTANEHHHDSARLKAC